MAKASASVDRYIATFSPEVQAILKKIRKTVGEAVPEAEETISYRMPAFRLGGMLVYFAAFKSHVGMYPPVRGNQQLMYAVAPYAGDKGNLRFPFTRPIPYALIRRIVKARARVLRSRAVERQGRR
jgi:uncharacterized protein YdhG (YjbR/CyaY superfamily)